MGTGSDAMTPQNTSRQRDPAEIRADIEQTRAQMSQTVDALQERLAPERLKNEALDKVRNATVGKVENFADDARDMAKGATSTMIETIKKNPVPAALVAIGLGWLFMERPSEGRQYRKDMYRRERYYSGGYGPYGAYGPADRPEEYARGSSRAYQAPGGIQDRMSQTAGSVQDKVSQAASNVQDTVSQAASGVQDTVSNVTSQASDTASQLADQAQHTAQRAKSRFEHMMQENPLLVGAAAIAVGAAIGLSLPSTQAEQKLMGETRDNLMDKAQDKLQDTMEKVQHVGEQAAQAATETAKQEAQKQNLTG